MPLKVMTIFGTRPEAVKMAPLVKELESRTEIQSISLHHGPAPPNVGRCAGTVCHHARL